MADIAQLGFSIDSRQVVDATKNVEELGSSSQKTAKSAKELGDSSKKSAKDIDQVTKSSNLATTGLANLTRGARNLLAAYAGFSVFRQTINNTLDQERAFTQLNATLRATGQYSDELSRAIKDFGSELQAVTTFGDDVVVSAQTMLLTFGQISGETFPRAIEAAADLAIVMGTDLRSAVQQVGRALSDPTQGLTLLRRAGVTFSRDQQDVIKSLVETNQLAQAQDVILAELEGRFGGSARAARDTLGGALQALSNSFGDLLEGENGLNSAKNAVEELTRVIDDPAVKRGFDNFVTGLITLTEWFFKATASVGGFLSKLGELTSKFVHGPADPIARFNAEIEKLQKNLAALEKNGLGGGMFGQAIRAGELRRQIADLKEQRDALLPLFSDSNITQAESASSRISTLLKSTLEDFEEATEIIDQNKIAIDNQVTALQFQSNTLGLTTRETKLYELALKGANTEQLKLAGAALETIEAFGKLQDLQRARTREDAFFAENERFMIQMDNLERLKEARILTDDNYRQLSFIAEKEHNDRLLQLAQDRFSKQSELNKLLIDSINTFQDSAASTFASLLVGTTNLRDAVRGFAQSVLQNAIGALVQLGVQSGKNKLLADTIQSATAAGAAVTGTAIASAYAPAAAMASLASFGANAAPAQAGITATSAIAKSLAIPSFEGGGTTGAGPRAGGLDGRGGFLSMLHPNETVIDNTKQTNTSHVTVNVINAPEGTQVRENRTEEGERVIDIIVNDIASGGDVSQSLENFYGMSRLGV